MTDEEAAKAFADSTVLQTGDTEFEKLTIGPLRDLATKAVLFGCAHARQEIEQQGGAYSLGRIREQQRIWEALGKLMIRPDPRSSTQFTPHVVIHEIDLRALIFGDEKNDKQT